MNRKERHTQYIAYTMHLPNSDLLCEYRMEIWTKPKEG